LDDTDFKDQIIKAKDLIGYDGGDGPVFIGHYWMNPKNGPSLLADKVACLDYSVAKGKCPLLIAGVVRRNWVRKISFINQACFLIFQTQFDSQQF
jgi:hypothetical protein